MTYLPFGAFHQVFSGELNPFLNEIDYEIRLRELAGNEKLTLYCQIKFAPDCKIGLTCESYKRYWFKDLYKITPGPGKIPLSKGYEILLVLDEIKKILHYREEWVTTFQVFEKSIELVLNRSLEDLNNLETRFCYYNLLFIKETRDIKKQLQLEVFSRNKKSAREQYIQHIQKLAIQGIERIKDLFHVTDKFWHHCISEDYREEDIFKLMLQYYEGITLHLYEHYRDYLDPMEYVPYFYRMEVLAKRKKERQYLIKSIDDGLIGDRQLGEVIKEFVVSFEQQKSKIPLHSLNRFEKVLLGAYNTLKESEKHPQLAVTVLSDVLQYRGLNSPSFFFYLTGRFEKEMNGKGRQEKIRYLKEKIKKYKKLDLAFEVSYNPVHPRLSWQIIDWAKEELSVLKDSEAIDQDEVKRFTFCGSVAELAIFMRALHESGILRSESKTEFLRTTSHIYSTPEKEEIRPKSLYNKFWSVDPATVSKVQEMFLNIDETLEGFK